jgi:hypothetical protein
MTRGPENQQIFQKSQKVKFCEISEGNYQQYSRSTAWGVLCPRQIEEYPRNAPCKNLSS